MKKKYHIYLTYEERQEIIHALNDKRNALINTGHYTDVIDEIFDERQDQESASQGGVSMAEITYTRQGDYNLPDLKLPEQEPREIGIWGQRRRRYLRENHKILYYNLLTQCKLINYLADINETAQDMYDRLVKQLAEQEGVTEQLKAENQLLWVAKMNNIRNRAAEIVDHELIYV